MFAGAAVGVAAVALLVTEPWSGAGAPMVSVPAAVTPTAGAVPTAGVAPSAVTEPSQSVAPQVDVCPAASPDAALAVGSPARCERGLVLEVPADEGFWVQSGPTSRLWVQLTNAGESPAWVQPGQRVSFLGSVVGHGPDYPARVGLDPLEGAADLRRQGAHVELAAADLAIVVPAP